MYSSNFYPDGLTERDIDLLITEAFESADESAEPTSALLDQTAAHRRRRRIEHRTVAGVVRAFPVRITPDGEAA